MSLINNQKVDITNDEYTEIIKDFLRAERSTLFHKSFAKKYPYQKVVDYLIAILKDYEQVKELFILSTKERQKLDKENEKLKDLFKNTLTKIRDESETSTPEKLTGVLYQMQLNFLIDQETKKFSECQFVIVPTKKFKCHHLNTHYSGN